ncbi:zinc finger protein 271-like isoform X2 [Bacillus rossius redtenbacheri]|uniref:zinc finger protein 271-like isoform X2 n=1 Tax=Bacillus rossius redtenbacheri TaxID=93214 RepID=UPI002FDE260E
MEMSDFKDVSPLQCRLCTSTDEGQLQIFGSDGLMRNIPDKIKECLPVTLKKEDALPKWVCQQCAVQLDQFHLFRKNCAAAETRLGQVFKEAAEFPLEPECCLQEVEPDGSQQLVGAKSPSPYDVKCLEDRLPTGVSLQPIVANGLTITPILPSDKRDHWPELRVGSPAPDDYVLMKEETFRTDGNRQTAIEESLHKEKDSDIVKAQRRRREVLPPMWDVYERASTYSTLVTHRRYIVNKAAFPCSLCNKCFSITQGYQRDGVPDTTENDERSSGDEGTPGIHFYTCHLCWKVFPKRSALQKHQLLHVDAQSNTCPLCGKAFGRKEHLSRHMISHTGGRPYTCELCSKPFVRKEHLDRHRLSHCKMLLEQGVALAPQPGQTDELPAAEHSFTCDVCLQTFPSSEQLVQHTCVQNTFHPGMNSVHNTYLPGTNILLPKLHSCSVCSKLFTRKEHLVRHLKVHQRESPHSTIRMALNNTCLVTALPQLNNCNNNDSKDNDLKHFLLSSAVSGLAEVKIEGVETTLDESMARSDGEGESVTESAVSVEACAVQKEGGDGSDGSGNTTSGADGSTDGSSPDAKSHPCPCCKTKCFSRKSHLVRHFKRAHPNQPLGLVVSRTRNDYSEGYKDCVLSNGQHLCKICGKMFGRRYHLIRHMKLHRNGVVPPSSSSCSVCKESFSDHSRLRSHACGGRAGPAARGAPDSVETSKENRVANVNGEKAVFGRSDGEGTRAKAARASPAGRGVARKRAYGYHHECVTCGINFSKKKLLKRHVESAHADSSMDEPP